MSFNYTDEQLNGLNQDYAVYSVNKDFSDRNKQKLVTSNPKNNNETNTITTSDGQEFCVIATKADPKTGFDGMAVAPIVNGLPDYVRNPSHLGRGRKLFRKWLQEFLQFR